MPPSNLFSTSTFLSQSFLNATRSLVARMWMWFTSALFALSAVKVHAQNDYMLGLGIADITGPVVETNMMGYASLGQTDTGLLMREYSRAFIVASPNSNSATDRIVFINSDIAMGDEGVRRQLISGLASKYGGLYTKDNVAFVGTHQHSGVGGYLENLLPQVTSLGYVKQTADAIVTGTLLAIQRAHDSLAPGSLSLGNTTIVDGNINRSPTAYENNPESERAQYQYDQDKDMTLLRFKSSDGSDRGFLSFFAVHGTSLYENNTLVASDNKGYAAYLYESEAQPDALPGKGPFVAGFTQSNVGDTSPNVGGAFCESPGQSYDGQPCERNHSTCGGTVQDCHGRGPAFTADSFGFASNAEIGRRQYSGAKTIMGGSLAGVSGDVRSVHVWMDMANHTFTLTNGTSVKTCPAAMGFAFAGGTTDGPGAFDFVQGDNSSDPQNPFWEIVKTAITPPPSPEQVACQYPKPILLNTGYAHVPYDWSPSTVSIQLLRVGNFVMLIVPGEFTTMAGRRIRSAVRAQLISQGIIGDDAYVVLAGPANTYGHYVTTREEYAIQRYEGGSTIFGQFTLEAYIDKYTSLLPYLASSPPGTAAPSDPASVDQTSKAISLQTGVIVDTAGIGKNFGDVIANVGSSYKAGDTVEAHFIGANPRNNLRLEDTFLSVDRFNNGNWTVVKSDSNPSTIYRWNRTNTILGTSTVNISWTIEQGTPAGTYRLSYYGDAKPLIGNIHAFTGHSGNFTVS